MAGFNWIYRLEDLHANTLLLPSLSRLLLTYTRMRRVFVKVNKIIYAVKAEMENSLTLSSVSCGWLLDSRNVRRTYEDTINTADGFDLLDLLQFLRGRTMKQLTPVPTLYLWAEQSRKMRALFVCLQKIVLGFLIILYF